MTEFGDPWALYLFIILVPVIILYLLRPKPKDMRIPSLMFIMDMEHKKRFSSFFKRIIRDPLLLMQLFALSLLILAIANPFYMTEETRRVKKDVAIVLDVSASMQAGSPSRFMQAEDLAYSIIDSLGPEDKVTVILSESIPVVILRQGDKLRARSLIANLDAKATPTGLGGSILLAADIIEDSQVERIIYVLSDFSNYEGVDPVAAQKTAFVKGISVEFIRVGSDEKNVGIISSRSGRTISGCFFEALVKNYGTSDTAVTASFRIDDDVVDSDNDVIGPGETGVFYLDSSCSSSQHEAVVSIDSRDSLAVDNSAYSIIKSATELRVLLIREKDDDTYIKYALESMKGISLSEAFPPIYPQEYSRYDVVIFQDAQTQNILAGTFLGLKKFVESGGSLVVLGFESLMEIDESETVDVLPVTPIELRHFGGRPNLLFDHQLLNDVDVEEISVRKYLDVDEKIGSITLVEILGSPLVTVWEVGNGEVVYSGINPDSNWSDFYLKPSFPIFWYNTLYWLNREESVGNIVNFKTGGQMPVLGNQTIRVRKPSGQTVEGVDILLDEAGFYVVEGSNQKMAASLVNEEESDLSYQLDVESLQVRGQYISADIEEEVINEFFWILAAIALGVIVLEWFYYKRRGSL